jgi:hypothetical protein
LVGWLAGWLAADVKQPGRADYVGCMCGLELTEFFSQILLSVA